MDQPWPTHSFQQCLDVSWRCARNQSIPEARCTRQHPLPRIWIQRFWFEQGPMPGFFSDDRTGPTMGAIFITRNNKIGWP